MWPGEVATESSSGRLSNSVKVKELQGTLCWETEKEPTFSSEESSSRGRFVSLRLSCNKDSQISWGANKQLMEVKLLRPCFLGAILGRKAARRPQRLTGSESIVWSGDLCGHRAPCFLRILAPAECLYEWKSAGNLMVCPANVTTLVPLQNPNFILAVHCL